VGDRDALAAVLAGVPAEHPLTGVVHTAGILDDGVLGGQNAERLAPVFRAKADAARHLHELTRDLDLAAFVLFSSGAGTFGNAGQSTYAAANGYLDGLAAHRRAQGLPAVSLAWGLWAETSGLTGRLGDAERAEIARSGQAALATADALALFDAALTADEPVLVPTRLDFAALRAQAAAGHLDPLYRTLVPAAAARRSAATGAGTGEAGGPEALVRRLAALDDTGRTRLLLDLVRTSAAAVLGQSAGDTVKPTQNFRDVGFDSLTAVRMRNRLTEATGLRLPATLVFDHPNPTAVAELLRDRLADALPATADAPADAAPALLAELDRLERVLHAATAAGGQGADARAWSRVGARLAALAARWSGDGGTPARPAADLDTATDDEIFELVENELGLS
jgi:acyl carrier protein